MFWSDPNLYGMTTPFKDIPATPTVGMFPTVTRFLPQTYGLASPFFNVAPAAPNPFLNPAPPTVVPYLAPVATHPFLRPEGVPPFLRPEPVAAPIAWNPYLAACSVASPLQGFIRPFPC